jgi:hypothetical protein
MYFEIHKMKHVLQEPWLATYRSNLQCFINISRVREEGNQPKSVVNVCLGHEKRLLGSAAGTHEYICNVDC